MQGDGNLCVYAGTGPADRREFIWGSLNASRPHGQYFAIVEPDGNLRVYSGTGPADRRELIWETGKSKSGPENEYFLVLSQAGELTLYAGPFPPSQQSPRICWRSGTFRFPPFTLKEIDELIQRYAPVLYFHPEERYFLSTVESYLEQSTLHDSATGRTIKSPKVSDLPTGTREGDRFWLDVPESARGGNLDRARPYVHVRHNTANNYTDFQFWFFSGYNGPGTAFLKSWVVGFEVSRGNANLAPMGEHYSDWEYVSLRINQTTKTLMSVFFSQHGGGERHDANAVERQGDQVVVYVSRNGHANYPHVSENFSEYRSYGSTAIGTYVEFMLRNDTGKGRSFNCARSYELVSADCLEPRPSEPRWLDYPYRWGPISATTHITVEAIKQLLRAAFGVLSIVLETMFLVQLAEMLLPIFVKDDRNGVQGPKQHVGSWNGDE